MTWDPRIAFRSCELCASCLHKPKAPMCVFTWLSVLCIATWMGCSSSRSNQNCKLPDFIFLSKREQVSKPYMSRWAVKPHPAERAGTSNFQMALRWISTVNLQVYHHRQVITKYHLWLELKRVNKREISSGASPSYIFCSTLFRN
jgi:hypothetical protein